MPEKLKSLPKNKFLFVRLDRIGDLVLTLPTDQVGPGLDVTWMIPKNLEFVLSASMPPRKFFGVDLKRNVKNTTADAIKVFKNWIHLERPDGIVIFHAPWWVYFWAWFLRVPVRAGVKSRWYSFFFLNRGVRQKRSQSTKNELDYNFDLVIESLGISNPSYSSLQMQVSKDISARVLEKFSLKDQEYFVVHPGMGGSAENWPLQNWQILLEKLSQENKVVVTGTSIDRPWVGPLKEKLKNISSIYWADEKLNPQELLCVLQHSRGVVAPSTGVIHLSASLGVKSIGIYSPVRVQAPERWGPKGRDTHVLSPAVTCPGHFKCLMQDCSLYNCMSQISVEQVLTKLLRK